ncbi:coenzyme A biosynthesis bifunctional protein CoaBC [Methanobrevibacter cuticularis]|uniref:Coenzyme A biosynthesis bifunctional protein CoaBC n=1 Tax=Methanobrevibacter cuticularis TaxID=47311 RepID=A0A166FGJ8_9EURY|nr:bifunctional phosphopantothenoylcysteine decarboxylase/phosphopantothenate--cysteine ligase CoaBC [Methanobrevibacter cuticularis]KZX17651.1 coenzyme A biosynthesis bifunctional protein CoaBC [Methanobrevibacter cuticularis]
MDIILCVTGSIAATESIKLAREFRREGFNVKCFISEDGCKIIHPNSMEFATGQKVVQELTGEIEHVKYANSDLILVAPATANIISKFSYKIADNPINSLLITADGHDTPILFVPSMHDSMYNSINENIEKLKSEGFNFVEPRMEEGKAKFPSNDDILLEAKRAITLNMLKKNENLKINNLAGKKILITLGGTYEAIDPVRGISNKSSGKMGLELAKEAYIQGMEVKLIVGKVDVEIPKSFDSIFVESSDVMNQKTKELISDYDIFIATAAVSDFAPIDKVESKLSSSLNLSLEFKPTEKIIKQIKEINPDIFLVGFKAEYNIADDKMIKLAEKQIKEAGTDLVVANDVNIKECGFGSDNNQVILVDNDNVNKIDICSKKEISKIVLDKINTRL